MTKDIKCLVVKQPYAWAICAGIKDIENRTWQTKYRGTIVIIASAKTDEVKARQKAAKPTVLNADHLTIGAAIGIADLVDLTPLNPELEANVWAGGPYCWRLADAKFFAEPIPCKGKLNLYAPEPELAVKIAQQLPKARPVSLDASGRAWHASMTHRTEEGDLRAYINSYYELEDWENLLRHLPRALAIEPENSVLYAMQGEALGTLERYEEALAVFNVMVAKFPDDPGAYAMRAYAFECLGDEESAERDDAKVLALDPHFFDDVEEPSGAVGE